MLFGLFLPHCTIASAVRLARDTGRCCIDRGVRVQIVSVCPVSCALCPGGAVVIPSRGVYIAATQNYCCRVAIQSFVRANGNVGAVLRSTYIQREGQSQTNERGKQMKKEPALVRRQRFPLGRILGGEAPTQTSLFIYFILFVDDSFHSYRRRRGRRPCLPERGRPGWRRS